MSKHPGFEKQLDKDNRGVGHPLIKPSHRGLLHEDLGVPQGEKIPLAKIKQAEHSPDPAERKRAQFADNFRKK